MFGWHHRFNGHEFDQALGVGDGQGSLACCIPWSHKELDTTELLSGEGNGTPFQYSCPENPMDREPGRLQSMGSRRVGHD